METRIRFSWQAIGAITGDGDKPVFPAAPSRPGVWRVTAGNHTEHGASQNLRQIVYQMASPGPSQGTFRRVNGRVRTALATGSAARLDVITSAERYAAGQWERLDLSHDDLLALVRGAAAAPAAADLDADPDSAEYRRAHEAARHELTALAGSELMTQLPAAKPVKPDNAEVRQMKRAAEALNAFVAECDRYWPTRWGHEGNPPG
jgi:hypothetical protein